MSSATQFKTLDVYKTLDGNLYDLSQLRSDERSLYSEILAAYRLRPDWLRFRNLYSEKLGNFSYSTEMPKSNDPLYRICQDLWIRLAISQGKMATPDYRDSLAARLLREESSRAAVCRDTGIDPGHLTRVLAKQSHLSVENLETLVRYLGAEICIQDREDIYGGPLRATPDLSEVGTVSWKKERPQTIGSNDEAKCEGSNTGSIAQIIPDSDSDESIPAEVVGEILAKRSAILEEKKTSHAEIRADAAQRLVSNLDLFVSESDNELGVRKAKILSERWKKHLTVDRGSYAPVLLPKANRDDPEELTETTGEEDKIFSILSWPSTIDASKSHNRLAPFVPLQCEPSGDLADWLSAECALSDAALRRSDLNTAKGELIRACDTAKWTLTFTEGVSVGYAWALHLLGNIYVFEHRYRLAGEFYRRSLNLKLRGQYVRQSALRVAQTRCKLAMNDVRVDARRAMRSLQDIYGMLRNYSTRDEQEKNLYLNVRTDVERYIGTLFCYAKNPRLARGFASKALDSALDVDDSVGQVKALVLESIASGISYSEQIESVLQNMSDDERNLPTLRQLCNEHSIGWIEALSPELAEELPVVFGRAGVRPLSN